VVVTYWIEFSYLSVGHAADAKKPTTPPQSTVQSGPGCGRQLSTVDFQPSSSLRDFLIPVYMIFRTPTLFTSFTVESWTNTLMGITPRLSFLYSGSESSRVPLRPLICSIASTFAAFTSFNHQATLNITAYNTPSAASCIHRHPVFILLHSFNHSFDWEPPHHQPGHSGAFIRSSHVTTDHSTLFSFLPSERFLTHFERHIHSFIPHL